MIKEYLQIYNLEIVWRCVFLRVFTFKVMSLVDLKVKFWLFEARTFYL